MTVTAISSLPTVECPVCHQQVPLGILGRMVGWHPVPGTGSRRRGCPGEGTPVPRPEPLEVPV